MLILHSVQPYYNVNSTFVNTKMLAIFNKIYHKKDKKIQLDKNLNTVKNKSVILAKKVAYKLAK